MTNLYRVTFQTKKNGVHSHKIDIEAGSMKQAREIAAARWYDGSTAHMFNVEARRLRDDEEFLYNWFKPGADEGAI